MDLSFSTYLRTVILQQSQAITAVFFHNDFNDVTFNSYNGFVEGTYVINTEIPNNLLNGGNFSIEPVAVKFKKYVIFKNVPGITVNISYDVPNTSLTYGNHRPGYLSPLFHCTTEKIKSK